MNRRAGSFCSWSITESKIYWTPACWMLFRSEKHNDWNKKLSFVFYLHAWTSLTPTKCWVLCCEVKQLALTLQCIATIIWQATHKSYVSHMKNVVYYIPMKVTNKHFQVRHEKSFTSIVVLIHSLEPANIIMCVRNQMDIQHGRICGWTWLQRYIVSYQWRDTTIMSFTSSF